MITLSYVDYDEALTIYYKTVEKSGGGMAGVRDEGGIRSTLDFVQDDLYYPEIADKAAYLMFSLCMQRALLCRLQQAHIHYVDVVLPGEERLHVSGKDFHGGNGGYRLSCGSWAY